MKSASVRRASATLAAVTAAALIGLAGAVPASAATCPAGQVWSAMGGGAGFCAAPYSGGIGSGSGSSTVVGNGGKSTGKAPQAPAYTPPPALPWGAKVGAVLKADKSGWAKGTTLKYRWLRNGATIPGASSATYKVRAADKGKTITVSVTGTKAGHKTSKVGKKYVVR